MSKTIITFGDIKIKGCRFYNSKLLVDRNNIDFDKIVKSDKIFADKKDFKYFGGQKVGNIRPLCMLPELLGNTIRVDKVNHMGTIMMNC